MAEVFTKLERHRDAIDALHKVIIIDPGFAEAHFDLDVAYSSIGNKEPALQR